MINEFVEVYHNDTIESSVPFIVRLDGRAFSSYTRRFKRPFDERITRAFQDTCKSLVEEFSPKTVYSQSDEISLVFIPTMNQSYEHIFGGKIHKILSILPAYTTSAFMLSLQKQGVEIKKPISFDARAIKAPNSECIYRYIQSRQINGYKNAVTMIAGEFYSPHKLDKISTRRRISLLKDEWDVSLYDFPAENLYGFFTNKGGQFAIKLPGFTPLSKDASFTSSKKMICGSNFIDYEKRLLQPEPLA